jgi:hypothetical protein
MSINYPKPHYNSTSEYQVSSWPYVTASATNELTTTPLRITFPYSTRWINVINLGETENIRVGFSRNGVTGTETTNFLSVAIVGAMGFQNSANSTGTIEVKCREIWLQSENDDNGTSTFQVIAGLTNIKRGRFPVLTASDGPAGETGGFIGVG